MSDPIRPRSATDEVLHRVLGVRAEAASLPTTDAAPDSAHEAPAEPTHDAHDSPLHALHRDATAHETVTTAVELLEPVLEHGGVLVAGELGPQALLTAIFSQGLAVYGTLAEGEQAGADFDSA